MKRHKYGYLVAGVAVLGLFLAGCHSTQSSSSATSQPKATHTAKKANPVDQVFKPLSQKVSEDAGTLTNGGEETYSQFYKKAGYWHWRLSSKARGTIAAGKILAVKQTSKTDNHSYSMPGYTLSMQSQSGEKYHLKLKYLDFSGIGYSVKTSYENINGNYLTCDTAMNGDWVTGAPTKLKAQWLETNFEKNVDDSTNKEPLLKRTFATDGTQMNSSLLMYDNQHKLVNSGSGGGVNQDLKYKQIGQQTYVLKSYSGATQAARETPNLVKIQVLGEKKIKIWDVTTKPIKMTYDKAINDSSSDNGTTSNDSTDSDSAVDTTNLTSKQAISWVKYELSESGASVKDYMITTLVTDEGYLHINSQKNNGSEHSWWRIDEKGRLQEGIGIQDSGNHWTTVSTHYHSYQ